MTLDALIGVAGKFDSQDLLNVYNELVEDTEYAANATKYEEGIVLDPGCQYYDEDFVRGDWPIIKHALETLMKMFPKNFVYYRQHDFLSGEDSILYMPNLEPVTEERIAKIDNAYRERKENEESHSLHNA